VLALGVAEGDGVPLGVDVVAASLAASSTAACAALISD